MRGAAVSRRPRRHTRPAGRRLGPDGAGDGTARHHPRGGPPVGADAAGVVDSASGRGVLRHRAGHPRRRRPPTGVDLPAHLSGAVGRRLHRVPGRRPVQPVRRIRSAAVGELRAVDDRWQQGPRPRGHLLRHGVDGVVAGVPARHRARLRGDRDAEHGRVGGATRRRLVRHPHRVVRSAAGGVRHQGGRVPALGVAARLLPHRARTRHGGVRRPADESRCVRDHPGALAAVPQRRAGPVAARGGAADHARRHPWRDRAERHQAAVVVHLGQPHRLHGVRHRTVQRARHVRARSTTWPTTSWCRRRCSSSSG